MTLALGHKSVADAQRWISSREFVEWMAYARLEPFGQDRNDIGAAVVASTILNVNRTSKAQKQYEIADLIPKVGYETEADREARKEALLGKFSGVFGMMGSDAAE